MSAPKYQKVAQSKYFVSDRAPTIIPARPANSPGLVVPLWISFRDYELDLGVEFLDCLKSELYEHWAGLRRAAHVYKHYGQGPVEPQTVCHFVYLIFAYMGLWRGKPDIFELLGRGAYFPHVVRCYCVRRREIGYQYAVCYCPH